MFARVFKLKRHEFQAIQDFDLNAIRLRKICLFCEIIGTSKTEEHFRIQNKHIGLVLTPAGELDQNSAKCLDSTRPAR